MLYKLTTLILLLFGLQGISQKLNHSVYIGANLSGINLDLSSSGVQNLNKNDFDNAKPGFSLGYKHLFWIEKKSAIAVGVDFKNANCTYQRPYYNDPNDIDPNLTSVKEQLKLYRFSIPVQLYYNVVMEKEYSVYASIGSGVTMTNKIKRTANYKIQSPPTGYIDGTYTGNQNVKFNNGAVGFSFISVIGIKFLALKRQFFIETGYEGDISKNKILTLHNIEYDNSYFGKIRSFQLKLGYNFLVGAKK